MATYLHIRQWNNSPSKKKRKKKRQLDNRYERQIYEMIYIFKHGQSNGTL